MISMRLSEVNHIMEGTESIHKLYFENKPDLLIDEETDCS